MATDPIPDILERIIARKRVELPDVVSRLPRLREEASAAPNPVNLAEWLKSRSPALIAEVKRASPSAGVIATEFDPAAIARAYEKGGADAISVLTDKDFFGGCQAYLLNVKDAVAIPVLRKDFIIDEAQIVEARALGADSFLLIAAVLSANELSDLMDAGRGMGMEPLVEVHDERELEKALSAGSRLVGVNNRNLRDFSVDLGLTARLSRLMPKDLVVVGESGVKTPEDAHRLYSAGCHALLIGETLMRSQDKADLIRRIKSV